MALRQQWEFSYKSGDVGVGAKWKEDHHKKRLEFWVKTQENLMAEIKETGIEVIKSQAASYGATNAAHSPQVVIRADMQTKLNECHLKIGEHRALVETYASFREALNLNPNQMIGLDVADIGFFFGKTGPNKAEA